ncbi:uncharacterized protein LOC106179736 [Lingula anatina]|uniref:Uncharacterized protein LOC106179736 n=1 Tax=Lingula anatina TaxID=7574 RepID=A0A1S3K9I2_LINAN|nr:uncharacterized protein LOC106179736 [Lingula anatina]|eukprot:XP_013418916.1 uncharacterized protein LOC106179736 [Lingula anatina]
MTKLNVIYVLVVIVIVQEVKGHGRMADPPARNSAWRYGFNTPPNYSDNGLYCGGKGRQWNTNGGKCGICGDPYDGKRDHEAGGRYATGTIVRSYQTGQVIDIEVYLTAAHKGWFEFRLCPHNNPSIPATQACLDRYLLQRADGSGARTQVDKGPTTYRMKYKLPAGLTCSQCVMQWKYRTGNSWGTDANGRGCLGCGPQEEFYNCADVSIGKGAINIKPFTTGPVTSRTEAPVTHTVPPKRTEPPKTSGGQTGGKNCVYIGSNKQDGAAHDSWCQSNCAAGYCPKDFCRCSAVLG